MTKDREKQCTFIDHTGKVGVPHEDTKLRHAYILKLRRVLRVRREKQSDK